MRRSLLILVSLLSFRAGPLLAIDLDGDGMSDVWQKLYNVPSADANADYNGTGLTNIQKSLLGIDPRAPNAVFKLGETPDLANNQILLHINTAYAKQYQTETSSGLTSWTSVGGIITGTGGLVDVTVTPNPAASSGFFRVRYTGELILSGDLFTTWEKHQLGLNEQAIDTDGDGIPDWWEWERGLNPLVNNANTIDPGGDGLTYLEEYQLGMSPLATDYYNGSTPTVTVIYGDAQTAAPNTFLNGALVAQVTNSNGQLLVNAPVVFTRDGGGLALTNDASASITSRLAVRTSANGWVTVYFRTPSTNSTNSITSTAGPVSTAVSRSFTETSSSSAPTPPPAPTPTSQSATIFVSITPHPSGSVNFVLHVGSQTVSSGPAGGSRYLQLQRGQSYPVSIVRTSGSIDGYEAHVTDFSNQYTLIDDPNGVLGSSRSYSQTVGMQGTLTLPQVQLITPAGDPIAAPDATYGSDGQNQFTFGPAAPGWLTIPMKVRVTPTGFANRIKANVTFSVSASGSISATSDSIQASGDYLTQRLMFQGLPQDNSGFGAKSASVSLRESGAPPDSPDASNDQQQCEIFFSKTATNHPGGQANSPNWYYYWKMTSANYGTHTWATGGGTGYTNFVNGSWQCFIQQAAGHTVGGTWGNAAGIDLFANLCRHEETHRVQLSNMWGASSDRNDAEDHDAGVGDYLKDSAEPTLVSGHPYDPTNPNTYLDTFNYNPSGGYLRDVEDYCLRSQPAWTNGAANGQDWADPGMQHIGL